jgi:hypothetical protein
MVSRFVLTLGLASLLSACAGPAVQAPPPEPAASTKPQVRQETQSQGGATQSLLAQARQARLDGALDKAEGLLLRAQRIDPRNATVYLEMSRLYATTGATEEARSIAERGLLYCSGTTCKELREAL